MPTWIRDRKYRQAPADEPRVRCDEHSLFDAGGFPLALPDDPKDSQRVWSPTYGGLCEGGPHPEAPTGERKV